MAVADLDEERGAAVARQFGIRGCCRDVDDLLASYEVDAVGVCTPPDSHARIAVAAMEAGKHVWVDKPLALSRQDCLRMIEQAKRRKAIAVTGFHMRFHRLVRQAQECLRGGAVGAVESVRLAWHSPRSDRQAPEWKRRRASGGGALIEIAVHHFDLLRMLLATEIAEVFALGRNGTRDDENAVVSARMSNGVLVSGEFSERARHEIEVVVNGAGGTLRIDCLRFDGLELTGAREVPGDPKVRLRQIKRFIGTLPEGIGVMRRGGDYRDSYRLAWADFLQAVRSGGKPGVTLDDGLRALAAVNAAVESRLTGKPVAVETGFPCSAAAQAGGDGGSNATEYAR